MDFLGKMFTTFYALCCKRFIASDGRIIGFGQNVYAFLQKWQSHIFDLVNNLPLCTFKHHLPEISFLVFFTSGRPSTPAAGQMCLFSFLESQIYRIYVFYAKNIFLWCSLGTGQSVEMVQTLHVFKALLRIYPVHTTSAKWSLSSRRLPGSNLLPAYHVCCILVQVSL